MPRGTGYEAGLGKALDRIRSDGTGISRFKSGELEREGVDAAEGGAAGCHARVSSLRLI